MLDALGGGDQCEVGGQLVFFLPFFHGLLALFDDALHRLASLSSRGVAKKLKSISEPFGMSLRLFEVFGESFFQSGMVRGVRHLGKGGNELGFGAQQVLQLFSEQVLKRGLRFWHSAFSFLVMRQPTESS